MRKLLLLVPAIALCAASGCSGDDKPAAKANGQAPSPAPPPANAVPAPPLVLKTPAPTGGEGASITWPTLATTGVPRGRKLKPSGPITVSKPGTVIDGLLVSTEINVVASNVTIRNTHLVGAGQWGIIQRKGASGLRVENSEINGDGRTKVQYGIVNQGGMITVRKTQVHTVSNGINTDHGLIEDNVIRQLKEFPKDHVTGVQSNSGPAPGLSLVVRHNVILNPVSQTSAISIYQDFGRAHDVTIEGNYLAGGGYALYGGKGRFGPSFNIKVVRNIFSRSVFKKGGFFGPVTAFEARGKGNLWQGNIWAETGRPVTP
ncbi:hypothetical protein J4573_48355 [Actinomadura barringtoniae]|uniref:Right handed beta helix domain-containing protein n=1 Tax=Actinomadura barringtoniae TaxID=1427535 RepID=A0A939T9A0_9ACTN|nr:hypothetical protein [Actinomadura barringtoniae]MBO2454973.1 hypothetical protein [Actinomadura barringtoniae]